MVVGEFLPFLFMLVVQMGYAGMNITSKVAMDAGMKPLVLVAYRQIFATLVIAPLAYIFEWKTRPKITKAIVFQIFLCSLTGITANHAFYFVGLQLSTPTIGSAMTNLLPAFTFILAVIFRQETVRVKEATGIAKVLGTVTCVGGAMILSFYHGNIINVGESKILWDYAVKIGGSNTTNNSSSFLGPLLLMASSLGWAAWFIIQVKVSANFPAPYTSTVMMLFMGAIECIFIALIPEHQVSAWSLRTPVRLFASLYAGLISSGLAFYLTTWCIQRKGALYASVFSPFMLIMVAIFSWALLREKLYVGTAVGSVLIVVGLYTVLWGKDKEAKKAIEEEQVSKPDINGIDLEFQQTATPYSYSNGNRRSPI
ncbi:WAT1-related protein At1g09380-like [Tripterygium wilfordii]|uniref:WAT1-related protein At1g09380-like n=1 Tax=Tripterygium wilfordii TaxID=458696 RepID=UPI0018F84282|nr:WAT1-related protein At1g09380-like [Tripterygium wilfordii]